MEKNDFFSLIYTYKKSIILLKSYKYRLYPTENQKYLLANIFGQVRFIYNLGLETKITAYAGNKKNLTCIDLSNQLIKLKKEYNWLNDSPSQALQMILRNLDNAYTNFFRGKGFPKYKNKYSRQSFQLPQGVKLSNDNKQIFIPKLKWTDIDLHREFKGEIKTITVSKSVTNKYYVSILVDNKQELPKKKQILESTSVGVDLGIKDFAITSDGKKFKNHDFFKSTQKQLRIQQRSLSRKKKGSNHYNKQRMRLSLLHEHIKNQRQDYLHKISKYLVDNYDTICIENLGVSNMIKNHKLSRAISDMGWGEFKSMLDYKCEWYGKNLSVIGRFDPSSKTCNCCGSINKELTLKDREWVCKDCSTIHDRDVNAAINIRNFGLRNQPSVAQSKSLDYACYVETTTSLV